ncbi:MAG: hypothetical protein HC918_07215 [Oscillatoriales cyanobacterium SM2_1_8]|nr:hypothetical protein [Oscillatoriales cyanobacterium SM2_1_8]
MPGVSFLCPHRSPGGECDRFAAPVAGAWSACALAEPVFGAAVATGDRPWALSPELGRARALEESGKGLEVADAQGATHSPVHHGAEIRN